MATKKTYSQDDLFKLQTLMDGMPSQKRDKFQELGANVSVKDKLYAALHDESFTLTEIARFLDSNGFSTTVDKLRQMRRVMFTLDIDTPADADPKKTIRLDKMRVHTWIAKKDG